MGIHTALGFLELGSLDRCLLVWVTVFKCQHFLAHFLGQVASSGNFHFQYEGNNSYISRMR